MFKFVATLAILGLLVVVAVTPYTPVLAYSDTGKAWSPNAFFEVVSHSSRLVDAACPQRAWPYYERRCIRDTRPLASQIRRVREISIDRLPSERVITISELNKRS